MKSPQLLTRSYVCADSICRKAAGYFYSRLQNPTLDNVASKICALEGGTAAMLTSSGQAANFFAVFNIAEQSKEKSTEKGCSQVLSANGTDLSADS